MADAPPLAPADESLSPLQLADGLLENVNKCPDCAKPVLQSAMPDHQANCLAIREGRLPDSTNLKRRLSEVSNGSGAPQKKSKLVLHLGGPAAAAAAGAGAGGVLPPGVAGPTAPPGKPADAPKKNKRVVDVDRQCGVINDKGYPCPRSLTCKTHNMSAKRAVPHRSQPYDLLLFEWQKTNKANQHKAELLKLANPAVGAGASGGAGAAAAAGGAASGAAGGTARTAAAAAAAAAAAGAHGSDASTPLGADPSGGAPGGSGADVPKAKRRRSSGVDALSGGAGGALGGAGGASVGALSGPGGFKLPGEGGGGGAGGKKGKKGIVYVGEWDESDDDGADELVDSDEEVEAVLRGLARAEHGRPLFIARGGGAGFAAASLFTGRNTKLARLRGTLRDVFRPAA